MLDCEGTQIDKVIDIIHFMKSEFPSINFIVHINNIGIWSIYCDDFDVYMKSNKFSIMKRMVQNKYPDVKHNFIYNNGFMSKNLLKNPKEYYFA